MKHRQFFIDAIKQYERERNGITALHPERYDDLAEHLVLVFNEKEKPLTPEQIIASVEALHGLLRKCASAFDGERITLYSNKIEELLKQLK